MEVSQLVLSVVYTTVHNATFPEYNKMTIELIYTPESEYAFKASPLTSSHHRIIVCTRSKKKPSKKTECFIW